MVHDMVIGIMAVAVVIGIVVEETIVDHHHLQWVDATGDEVEVMFR